MRVDVHLWCHGESATDTKLDHLIALVREVLAKEAAMAGELDRLTTEVSETRGVIDSAIALIRGFKAALDAAIAAGNPAALTALSDSLDTKTNELAQAITDNPLPAAETP